MSNHNAKHINVIITLNDGQALQGRIVGGLTSNLGNALAREGQFVEFIPMHGNAKFISKQRIAEVEALENLESVRTPSANFDPDQDPYATLGVPADTSFEMVREAYHKLAKAYHPDRVAAADLPADMRIYANTMLTRINQAYDMIKRLQETA